MGQYKRRKFYHDRILTESKPVEVDLGPPVKVVGSNTMNFTLATNGDLIADSSIVAASSWKVTDAHVAIVADLVAGIQAQLSAQMGALESAIVNITVN